MALPKYEQIASELRARIVRGDLKPGDALPSGPELMAFWSVAKATAQKAVDLLVQEGLVESRQGSGTYVRERAPLARTAGERYQTARQTGTIYTSGEHAKITAAELVDAPASVAAALGIEAGAQVLRRERVTYEGQQPVSTSVSWFLGDVATVAPRLLELDRIKEGTTRYLELQTGRRPATGRDVWSARLATAEERERLALADPEAVAETHHTSYDTEGAVLEYAVGITPAGRWARTEVYALDA